MQASLAFTPLILIHVAAAGGALVLGGLTLALRKGTAMHKLFGRLWVVLMLVAALVSFGIQRSGHFSAIHVLSVITIVSVSAAIVAAARGRISAHRRGMTAVYASLVVAAIFTLLPGRRLGDLLWNAVVLAQG
ncbi:DUF2306 domain-containing protein [Noviherbaspirillum sp. 17J57-3]|uniref:DUF2306 domain-containing protein n=2 Tax=Noviherbaspirillum galbum TaxID=2709383 RepID=A0A6B3SIL3_9BURK|nr:DUF2306 domain-containing protein [Noviherbaspirillum galbum]